MNELINIEYALREALDRLQSSSESPRLDAELLLARSLDVPRSYLFAHPEDTLDPASWERFIAVVDRRAGGEPLSYITGEREFWSMSLMVSPATLIPRPETETLIERALLLIGRKETLRILDLGTGSGAIALAIARERPHCDVVATDASEHALAVARQNARQLDIVNVTFFHGNWIDPVATQRFDLIVSNPPYVRAGDPALEGLRHEPLAALVAGHDGLGAIRCIAQTAGHVLLAGGKLLLEHGSSQQDDVASVLRETGWCNIECVNDFSGLPRVTIASRQAAA